MLRGWISFVVGLVLQVSFCFSQNETSKWYFGQNAGLDFLTSPPSSITGSMVTPEGCSSISDLNGNLLFYANGVTIWNQFHQVMASGNGMSGNPSTTQGGLIVKQLGNGNLYYVFTLVLKSDGS